MTENDLASEPAVASACGADGASYRYGFALPPRLREASAGAPIYVHGISRFGGPNSLLEGSGLAVVPPPGTEAGGCSRIPAGFFKIGRTIYYSNGEAFCGFGSWESYKAAGGPDDTRPIPSADALPTCMANHGTCRT